MYDLELAWNTQKNQMKDVKGKEMEQERKGKISNEDIDLDRTKNNYDLVEDERTLHQRVKNRVDELKENGSRVQKNSVVMYSNILTVPEEQAKVWGEEKTDDYFKACYDFFSKEFGIENVVSAKVHKDETAPHMHLHFVPVNKENGRLQARVSMNKAKINYIHDELPKFLQERGFDVVRGKGKTEKNIENIHEYKEIKALEEKIEQEKKELNKELEEIKLNKKPLVNIKRVKERSFEKGIREKNKRVEVPLKDFDELIASAKENEKLRKINHDVSKTNKELKQQFKVLNNQYQKIVDQQQAEYKKLENKNIELQKENKELKQELGSEIDKRIVYADVLINDFNVTAWSKEETKARLVLNKLDRGVEPSNVKQGQEWRETLEKARGTNIKSDRLERGISKIKEIIQKIKEKILSQRKNKQQGMRR